MQRALFLTIALALHAIADGREWSDPSGRSKVEAALIGVKNGKVYLERNDGTLTSVPIEKLHPVDQAWLLNQPEYSDYFEQHPLKTPAHADRPKLKTISAPDGFTHGEIRRFPEMQWPVSSLAVSPDGGTVAVGKIDRTILLLDVERTAIQVSLEKLDQLGSISCLRFSSDGTKLLAGGSSGRIVTWQLKDGERPVEIGHFAGHDREVATITISPDGNRVVSGGADKTMRCWELASGDEIHVFEQFRGTVRASFITPKGHQAMGCDGESLILFDLTTGRPIQQMKLGSYATQAVAISPSGRRVIFSDGYLVRAFATLTGLENRVMESEAEIQWSLVFSPNGKWIASGGRTRVSIWEAATGRRRHVVNLVSGGYVKAVAFSPDSQHLAAIGTAGRALQMFRLPKFDDAASTTGKQLSTGGPSDAN